jgi:hypothetical protein
MLRRFVLLVALLGLPSPALAWWEYGHETVARIAWLAANPHTRAEIRRLLARSDLLETPTCPARTIAQASIWPDCIKTLQDRFSYASPWHYQNVDVCREFDQQTPCRDGNCVSAQIERNARLLADRGLPLRERVMALAFLVHFVGDLHQPLHAGDRGDLGGNRLAISYGIIAGRTNLHLTWDGYLAERAISTPPADAAGLLADLDPAERATMRLGSVTDWARESWEASREYAYGTALADPCGHEQVALSPGHGSAVRGTADLLIPAERPMIDEATTQRLIPIVRRQITRGGLRLARLLDQALA